MNCDTLCVGYTDHAVVIEPVSIYIPQTRKLINVAYIALYVLDTISMFPHCRGTEIRNHVRHFQDSDTIPFLQCQAEKCIGDMVCRFSECLKVEQICCTNL